MVSSKPKFFKVLLPGTFENELSLPPRFVRQTLNPEGTPQGTTILCGPSGELHHVGIHRDGARLCFFGSGWLEFVQGNAIAAGQVLVLCYEGRAVVSVDVFDDSGCPMENSGSGMRCSTTTARQTTSTVSRSEAHGKRPHSMAEQSSLSPPPDRTRGNNGVAPPDEVTFKKVITHPYLITTYLRVPKAFCVSAGLMSPCEVEMQKAGERMVWKVNFGMSCHRHQYFTGGWRWFCEAYGVEVGDRCIFRLVEKNRLEVQVVKCRAGASSDSAICQ